ncbi:hypothetical protein DMUE_3629 [Dictyocoela muelleri]|nr:hypothetical protein DMUE_3629 [Dictyocoela muelleri]
MATQNPNNYHWSEINITEWAEKFIYEKLSKLEFQINELKSNIYVTQRMNKVSIVYFITGKISKNGSVLTFKDFDNYCDLSDLDGDSEIGKLFLDVVEEMQTNAKENFSEKILVGKRDPEVRKLGNLKELSNFDNVSDQKYEKLIFNFRISCSKDEFIDFISNPEYVKKWTSGQFCFENDGKKLILNGEVQICFDGNNLPNKFKMKEWDNNSDLDLKFISYENYIEVTFYQRHIPTGSVDTVKNFWFKYCIEPICKCFDITYYL